MPAIRKKTKGGKIAGRKKGKAKKGKKGKGKKGKKTKPLVGAKKIRSPGESTQQFHKAYVRICKERNSTPVAEIVANCKEKAEEDKAVTKFTLEPASRFSQSVYPPVVFADWLKAVQEMYYDYVKELCVWGVRVTDMDATNLALCMETDAGRRNLELLTFLSTSMTAFGLKRIIRSIRLGSLVRLNVSHNRFGDEGCLVMCDGIAGNYVLQYLSMDFCGLTPAVGEKLGQAILTSGISELSLGGNSLQCDGLIQLINPYIEALESRSIHEKNRREQLKEFAEREAEKRKERAALGPLQAKLMEEKEDMGKLDYGDLNGYLVPSPPLPPLKYMNVEDNGIDVHGKGGKYAPVVSMRLVRRWIEASAILREINLCGNLIGEPAARELLTALEARKEASLSPICLTVTHCIEHELFAKIVKLGSVKKKKKKLLGKKKKKKGKRK